MATYKVHAGQNIWDIALHLYGSIEGVFDLLISNKWLNMTTEFVKGMELEYHESFVVYEGIVDAINEQNYLPANGERHVYHKSTNTPLKMVCLIPSNEYRSGFIVSGSGTMVIDWGDNSDLEFVNLSAHDNCIEHYFDNTVDNRRIRCYGEFELIKFNIGIFNGSIYPTQPIVVNEFISHSNNSNLKGLLLFKDTVVVDLRNSNIDDLTPIYNMSLQELNLLGVKFSDVSVIDNYLQNIVKNYSNRRDCTVWLDTEPSDVGMNAILTIINEPSWNESGKWKFVINNQIYTAE